MPHCLRSMVSTLTRQAVGINHCIIVHWPTGAATLTGREGLWGSDCCAPPKAIALRPPPHFMISDCAPF
jgi:hypothetical protein